MLPSVAVPPAGVEPAVVAAVEPPVVVAAPPAVVVAAPAVVLAPAAVVAAAPVVDDDLLSLPQAARRKVALMPTATADDQLFFFM